MATNGGLSKALPPDFTPKSFHMKKNLYLYSTLIALAFGCKSPNEQAEEAKDDLKDAQQEQAEAQSEYDATQASDTSDYAKLKAGTKKIIADNERRIAEFKVKLASENAESRKKLQTQIDTLEARNERLSEQIDSYKAEGEAKWKSFRSRIEKSVDDIERDIDNYKNKNE